MFLKTVGAHHTLVARIKRSSPTDMRDGILCVFCVCALLKVVSHYDLSVLSMSVMGIQKKWIGGWVW